MNPDVVLWILIAGMLGVGIYTLRGAIRNSFKDVESKKAKARMVRAILGETGFRYFLGIIGTGFIVTSLGLCFLIMGGGKMIRNSNPETDIMIISKRSDDPTVTSSVMATESQLKMSYDIIGDQEFDRYQHLSLKNHYRSSLPDIVLKMKNLESIDLTNNEFTELPLEQLKNFPKLKQLTLDGNPIEKAYLAKIQTSLGEILVVKNEIVEP
jgi:hypothetical protein